MSPSIQKDHRKNSSLKARRIPARGALELKTLLVDDYFGFGKNLRGIVPFFNPSMISSILLSLVSGRLTLFSQ